MSYVMEGLITAARKKLMFKALHVITHAAIHVLLKSNSFRRHHQCSTLFTATLGLLFNKKNSISNDVLEV